MEIIGIMLDVETKNCNENRLGMKQGAECRDIKIGGEYGDADGFSLVWRRQ